MEFPSNIFVIHSWIFGANLLIYGILSAPFIFFSCQIIYLFGRFGGLIKANSIISSMLLYMSLIYGVAPVARLDIMDPILMPPKK
jgi:hypothetical protein